MLRQPDIKIHVPARLCRISTFSRLIRVKVTELDAIDQQIVHILAVEPRASFRVIAAVTGISDQTAATTGPTNLLASAVLRDTRHLYEYLTGELAALPGVSSVQTAPIIRTLKRTGSVHEPAH